MQMPVARGGCTGLSRGFHPHHLAVAGTAIIFLLQLKAEALLKFVRQKFYQQ